MKDKSYNILGRLLKIFSIITSMISIFLSFRGGRFTENLRNNSFSISLNFTIVCILFIISGFRIKKKYPKYYKYQIISGTILLITVLLLDIIPRIIYLT